VARRFFYVSLGILALAIAYSTGARQAEAQSSAVVFAGIAVTQSGTRTTTMAITTGGDVYARDEMPQCSGGGGTMTWNSNCQWTLVDNVLGGPVPVEGSSFGAVKGAYR
jgi:hypothetical protein